MKQKRGFFNSIFGKVKNKIEAVTHYQLLNSFDMTFTPYSGNSWDISTVRASVSAFARHAAKVTPRHVRRGADTLSDVKSSLDRLLQTRPNPYMTAYAMFYKIAVDYKLNNNAFLYPVWEGGKITAIYPIMARQIRLVEYKSELYCEFMFANGKSQILPYSEVIHIRNYFYDNDIFGSDNRALDTVLDTANSFTQSMSKFAELISVVRGVLKVKTAVKDEVLSERRDEFVRDNLRLDNNGSGLIVTDSKFEYIPMNDKAVPIPKGQLEYVKSEVYNYFGTNENIIQNKFNEDEWAAFYEGEIEPFAVQLSQAMTNCFFTEKEKGFGNEILVEANRLQYASTSTKIEAGTFLTSIGAASLDQILEIFNMAPIGGEEGKRRVQTLNAANVNIVDNYQLSKGAKGNVNKGNSEEESDQGDENKDSGSDTEGDTSGESDL